MRVPRITVLRLMILVAVVGLLLAGGIFARRCYRVREYALRRVAEMSVAEQTYEKGYCSLYGPVWEGPSKKKEFEHVARHPWHGLPYGEEIGPTPHERIWINISIDETK
jgi:hypothetical protein